MTVRPLVDVPLLLVAAAVGSVWMFLLDGLVGVLLSLSLTVLLAVAWLPLVDEVREWSS